MSAVPQERPVRLIVDDDLRRNRWTVFFRLILAIPLLIVYAFWSIGALLVAIAAWFVLLVRGRLSDGLHGFLSAYVRFTIRMNAYLHLVANPYPSFDTDARYGVDVEIAGPAPQSRWSVGFRIVLAIPVLVLLAATGGGLNVSWRASRAGLAGAGGTGTVAAILGWFASLARGRMPRGLRDLGAYSLGYSAEALAYLLLLTDRYPSTGPELGGPMELPDHPVQLDLTDDVGRSRVLVFFRILLVLPHLVWLALWGVVVVLAAIAAWLVGLVRGRLPDGLHSFLAAYVRYGAHVTAFLYLVGGPFPGFVGAQGSYPVDVRVAAPVRQSRWTILFRGLLAIPAFLVAGAYDGILFAAGVLGWFYALFTGRMPHGLRDIGAAAVRYQAQSAAYFLLLTPAYPYAAPALEDLSAQAAPDSWAIVA